MLKEFSRYTITNILVFILDVSLLFILTEFFNVYYLLSASISIAIGFSMNYYLNVKWVFEQRKYFDKPIFEYFLMIVISVFVSGINITGIWLLSEYLQFYYLISKISISTFTLLVKFFLRKVVLF
mgnify:FL=1